MNFLRQKAVTMWKKVTKLDVKILNVYTKKGHHKENEKTNHKARENVCIIITNKGLVTRIHKDSHKSMRKRNRAQKALTSTSENRKSKWPINMKRSSTSLVIREDTTSHP